MTGLEKYLLHSFFFPKPSSIFLPSLRCKSPCIEPLDSFFGGEAPTANHLIVKPVRHPNTGVFSVGTSSGCYIGIRDRPWLSQILSASIRKIPEGRWRLLDSCRKSVTWVGSAWRREPRGPINPARRCDSWWRRCCSQSKPCSIPSPSSQSI
jgi:hypothetical protein